MKHIDEQRLEEDTNYRFEYLAEFMGFGSHDVAAIQAAAPLLQPLVPALVDAVYNKLHTYDCTWRHFIQRQAGYEGAVPQTIDELTPDHPQIKYRKQHLAKYLEHLVSQPYDGKMVLYLDMVGKIHTPMAGNPEIHISIAHMNALIGFVADALTSVILGADLADTVKADTVRAFSKLLWLQNDLIVKHYVKQNQ